MAKMLVLLFVACNFRKILFDLDLIQGQLGTKDVEVCRNYFYEYCSSVYRTERLILRILIHNEQESLWKNYLKKVQTDQDCAHTYLTRKYLTITKTNRLYIIW